MEKFTDNAPKKETKREDSNFTLIKGKLDPFKVEIYCDEFLDILADVICNPSTRYNSIDEMVDDIKKPITMKIDPSVYDAMFVEGEKKDIELVCKYVAVSRIMSCQDDPLLIKMMDKAREALRSLNMDLRHVMSSDKYKDIFGIIPAAYLCSVCNLGKVSSEVSKMDKSKDKINEKVMAAMNETTQVDVEVITECHNAAVDFVQRVLFAYRDHNMIDLGSLRDALKKMFENQYSDHFQKLITTMNKDVSDSFGKFDQLVQDMKQSVDSEMDGMDDAPDPMVTDPVDIPMDNPDDSVLSDGEPIMISSAELAVTDNTGGDNPPPAGGVVTGLEGVFPIRKKLKRISRDAVGYVKVRGVNARDCDELCLAISYGYSVAERCEWYMELIQNQDERYVVPQTYAELDNIKNEMYRVLDELTKNPKFRERGRVTSRGYDFGYSI